MPSTSEMRLLQEHQQRHPTTLMGTTRPTTASASRQKFRDPTSGTAVVSGGGVSSVVSGGNRTSQTAAHRLQRDPREGQYVLGKKIQRARASTFKGTGHNIPVRQANDADFIAPRSSLNIAPSNHLKHRGTFGSAPKNSKPIRETAVNKDAVKRAMDLQPADVQECSELKAPLYSSFRCGSASMGRAGSWGRPSSAPFKPYAGEAALKRTEVTEFTTEVPSSIRAATTTSLGRASSLTNINGGGSLARNRSSLSRTSGGGSQRLGKSYGALDATTTDRTGGWLPHCKEDTPGPGQYFIP